MRRRRCDDVVACERERAKEQVHMLIRNSVHVLEVPPSICYIQEGSPPTCLCSFFLFFLLFVPFSLSLSFSLFFLLSRQILVLLQKDPFFVYKSHNITNDLLSNKKSTYTLTHKKRERNSFHLV